MTFWIQWFLVGSRDTVLYLVTSYLGLLIGIGSLVVHYGDGGGEEEKKEARGEMLSGMALEGGLGGRSRSPAVVVHGSREALVARDGVGELPWWPEPESSCGGPWITRGLGGP